MHTAARKNQIGGGVEQAVHPLFSSIQVALASAASGPLVRPLCLVAPRCDHTACRCELSVRFFQAGEAREGWNAIHARPMGFFVSGYNKFGYGLFEAIAMPHC